MEQEKLHVHIRDASPSERDVIRSMTLASYEQYATVASPSIWALLQQAVLSAPTEKGPMEQIVAEYAGKIVGSVRLYQPSMSASHCDVAVEVQGPEVRLLAVDPALQGHGIGKALLFECIKRAQNSGHSTLGLHTGDAMQKAIQMYEHMGFVHVPELDFQTEDGSIMKGYRLELEKITFPITS